MKSQISTVFAFILILGLTTSFAQDYETPYLSIEKIATLEKGLRGGARSVTFSPDGKLLASVSLGRKINLWRLSWKGSKE